MPPLALWAGTKSVGTANILTKERTSHIATSCSFHSLLVSVTTTEAAAAAADTDEVHPAVAAYDDHVARAVIPFADACDALGGLGDTGANIKATWSGIRSVIVIGTKCKKPADVPAALTPHLKPTQDAIGKIRTARLDRSYDWHIKAMVEMLQSVSWVVMSAPPAPTSFVKETVGSTDFWANKIRKEYKGKDEKQIDFCDKLKALILDLADYLKNHHLSGLSWNPRGVELTDAVVADVAAAAAPAKAAPAPPAAGGGGTANIMAELSKKQTQDGSSAATGLKKVTKDMQTWRKEYKKDPVDDGLAKKAAAVSLSASDPTAAAKSKGHKTRGPPVFEYQDRGFKWCIENQTKDTNPNGLLNLEVKDPKQQAYVYNCEGATIQITGKIKSIILDKCTRCNLVFDSAISACEIVNCKSVQIQVKSTCPSFSIDKTDGCLVYLSKESIPITTFVTSKSSEMNVSWPDENDEMKEAPIPEQFQHKLVNGSITSDVSDLYH